MTAPCIRNIELSDQNVLQQIARNAVTLSVVAPEEEKQNLLKGISRNIASVIIDQIDGVFLAAALSEVPVGFIIVKDYWNLSDLFVDPDHQGLGIGRQLCSDAFAICEKENKKPSIRANSSLNAVTFYDSLGFYRIDVEQKLPDFIIPLEYSIR